MIKKYNKHFHLFIDSCSKQQISKTQYKHEKSLFSWKTYYFLCRKCKVVRSKSVDTNGINFCNHIYIYLRFRKLNLYFGFFFITHGYMSLLTPLHITSIHIWFRTPFYARLQSPLPCLLSLFPLVLQVTEVKQWDSSQSKGWRDIRCRARRADKWIPTSHEDAISRSDIPLCTDSISWSALCLYRILVLLVNTS